MRPGGLTEGAHIHPQVMLLSPPSLSTEGGSPPQFSEHQCLFLAGASTLGERGPHFTGGQLVSESKEQGYQVVRKGFLEEVLWVWPCYFPSTADSTVGPQSLGSVLPHWVCRGSVKLFSECPLPHYTHTALASPLPQ